MKYTPDEKAEIYIDTLLKHMMKNMRFPFTLILNPYHYIISGVFLIGWLFNKFPYGFLAAISPTVLSLLIWSYIIYVSHIFSRITELKEKQNA